MPTKIEWCEETWNPIVGCTPVSPGCQHCYAARFAHRGLVLRHRGLTKVGPHGPMWNGTVRTYPELLEQPLHWRKPRCVFVCSMGDLFHSDVPPAFIERVFGVMRDCPQHTFQVLTKRPRAPSGELGRCLFFDWPPNVWAGVTVENREALGRVESLRHAAAPVRFLSCEPLLEDLGELNLDGIRWVIVGGETGPGARPMHPDWARSIRDQCVAAGVPFFFRQWGEHAPWVDEQKFTHGGPEKAPHAWVHAASSSHGLCWIIDDDGVWSNWTGRPPVAAEGCAVMAPVGKKAAGRELDGRTWDEMPGVSPGTAVVDAALPDTPTPELCSGCAPLVNEADEDA